ncbi:hypothetical protein ACW9UR_23495 [Halovulum sp. GXIMD14794]
MSNYLSEHLQIARDELRAARALLQREVQDYPMPIAGCDQQYNHIRAQLDQVRTALAVLERDT